MPIWIARLLPFIGKRSVNFLIYGLAALVCWGIYKKIFVTPNSSTKIGNIEKQVNVYNGQDESARVPLFGCSAWKIQNEVYWKSKANLPTRK